MIRPSTYNIKERMRIMLVRGVTVKVDQGKVKLAERGKIVEKERFIVGTFNLRLKELVERLQVTQASLNSLIEVLPVEEQVKVAEYVNQRLHTRNDPGPPSPG